MPALRRSCGIVALWPNESTFAPTVAVIAERRAGSAGRTAPGGRTTRPHGMLQSGSTHQPPTICQRPSATRARICSNSSGSLSSTHARRATESHGEDEVRVLVHAVERGPERGPRLLVALLPLPQPHRVDVRVADHVQTGSLVTPPPRAQRVDLRRRQVQQQQVHLLDARRRRRRDDEGDVGVLAAGPPVAAAEENGRRAASRAAARPRDDVRRAAARREADDDVAGARERLDLPGEDILEASSRSRCTSRPTGSTLSDSPRAAGARACSAR